MCCTTCGEKQTQVHAVIVDKHIYEYRVLLVLSCYTRIHENTVVVLYLLSTWKGWFFLFFLVCAFTKKLLWCLVFETITHWQNYNSTPSLYLNMIKIYCNCITYHSKQHTSFNVYAAFEKKIHWNCHLLFNQNRILKKKKKKKKKTSFRDFTNLRCHMLHSKKTKKQQQQQNPELMKKHEV